MVRKRKGLYSILMLTALLLSIVTPFKAVSAAENKIKVEKGADISEYDTIQQAIDSVQNNENAVISVPAGSYDEAITITNTKDNGNRSIVLKGAQAGNSAVVAGEKRNDTETVLTNGIEVQGLHDDASVTIDGFTMINKGINILGWGNMIESTGNLRILNNVITDIENGSVSAIHVNANAATEFIGTFDVLNNYIADVGGAGNAVNGVYFTLTADYMNVKNNVIRDVNHSCINFSSSTIKTEAIITDNAIANWNRDGDSGSGALGSQGDGIYITKTNTLNTVPIEIHRNVISRSNTLPGSKGYAVRCALNKGKIDLNENYWNSEMPLSVISGGTYANVTIGSVCDENMTVTNQSIANFTFTASELYVSGKNKERKLSAAVTMLDKTAEKPSVIYNTTTPELVTIETRDDGVYYIAKKAGEAKITASVIDPSSNQEYQLEQNVLLKDIVMSDQRIGLNESVEMTYELLPQGTALSTLAKATWISSNEDIVTIDENGVAMSTGKEGTATIELTISLFSTQLYHASAEVTVAGPIVNTPPIIHANDRELTQGEAFDPLENVTASDQEDGDISASIQVTHNDVDSNQAGVYHVTYEVRDSEGAAATKTITITVKELEMIELTVASIIEGKTGTVAAELAYEKGFELNAETMNTLLTLIETLTKEKEYEGYHCEGLFLDKEGTQHLEIGQQFHEDTLIYLLWAADETELPTEPSKPEQPSDDDSKDEIDKPSDDEKPMPEDTDQNPKPSEDSVDKVIVNTGDTTSIAPYLIALCSIAGSYFMYCLLKKKRRNES